MNAHVRSASLFAVSFLLTSCYSLATLRVHQTVRADQHEVVLGVWIRAPGPVLSDPDLPVYDAAVAIVFYPLDVVASTCVAVSAPFDPDLDISWGPIGAIAGVLLPCVTLMPYLYPARHMMFPPPNLEVDRPAFEALISRVTAGDGVRGYRDIVGQYPWDGGSDAMLSVELIEPCRAAADRPTAASAAPRTTPYRAGDPLR